MISAGQLSGTQLEKKKKKNSFLVDHPLNKPFSPVCFFTLGRLILCFFVIVCKPAWGRFFYFFVGGSQLDLCFVAQLEMTVSGEPFGGRL